MKTKMNGMLIALFMVIGSYAFAQVAVNDDNSLPNASAMLDVTSNTKGFLMPRMTAAERLAISTPATGLMVYQTDPVAGYYYYNGTAWVQLINSGLPAGIAGQTMRYDGSAWVANSLLFNNGTNVGIGTTSPVFKLDVTGADASLNGVRVGRGGGNGSSNTAVGFEAMNVSTNTGDYNCASGYRVLKNITSGDNNTGQGYAALISLTKGTGNTATGFKSLFSDTTGSYNTANGYAAMYFNLTGKNNTASGLRALYNNTAGYSNVAVGAHALYTSAELSNLVAIGDSALYNNGNGASGGTQGSGNTAIGSKSLFTNTTGYYNTAGGFESLLSNLAGNFNTAFGYKTLTSSTGNSNVALGANALLTNTAGSYNTACGVGSLFLNKANNRSTALGYHAMYYADNTTTGTDTYNTAVGCDALKGGQLTTNSGKMNTAVGDQALAVNSTGSNNTATGFSALVSNTTGGNNVAYGYNSLNEMAGGNYNTAIGAEAMTLITTSSQNITAVGRRAGAGYLGYYTGSGSTLVGSGAMANGTNTTMIGYGAGPLLISGLDYAETSNSVGIGYNVEVSGNNQVRLGNSAIQTFYCQGAYIGTVGTTNRDLYADNTGKIGYVSSSVRYKDNIADLRDLNWLYDLRPVTFTYKTDANKVKQYGLIAEEVEKVNPEFVSYNDAGKPETVSYSALVTPLLKAVQDQQKMIDQLRKEIELLKAK